MESAEHAEAEAGTDAGQCEELGEEVKIIIIGVLIIITMIIMCSLGT